MCSDISPFNFEDCYILRIELQPRSCDFILHGSLQYNVLVLQPSLFYLCFPYSEHTPPKKKEEQSYCVPFLNLLQIYIWCRKNIGWLYLSSAHKAHVLLFFLSLWKGLPFKQE